jgi:hypothetical protein
MKTNPLKDAARLINLSNQGIERQIRITSGISAVAGNKWLYVYEHHASDTKFIERFTKDNIGLAIQKYIKPS